MTLIRTFFPLCLPEGTDLFLGREERNLCEQTLIFFSLQVQTEGHRLIDSGLKSKEEKDVKVKIKLLVER